MHVTRLHQERGAARGMRVCCSLWQGIRGRPTLPMAQSVPAPRTKEAKRRQQARPGSQVSNVMKASDSTRRQLGAAEPRGIVKRGRGKWPYAGKGSLERPAFGRLLPFLGRCNEADAVTVPRPSARPVCVEQNQTNKKQRLSIRVSGCSTAPPRSLWCGATGGALPAARVWIQRTCLA